MSRAKLCTLLMSRLSAAVLLLLIGCRGSPPAPPATGVAQCARTAPNRCVLAWSSGSTPAAIPRPSSPSDCPPNMGWLPGGTFRLGWRGDVATVLPFCMDLTEVTVADYTACVDSGSCCADHPRMWTSGARFDECAFLYDAACNYGVAGREHHPMNCVDWTQAATFCRAQGKRLPGEEEWEWAARGGNRGTVYPWGNTAPGGQLCWSAGSRRDGTCPAGGFPAGDAPEGIHDLAGNVAEWTATPGIYRGGDWVAIYSFQVAAAERGSRISAATRDSRLGFRCVR